MSRSLKLTALMTFTLLLPASAASAQSPYPSLSFAREPNTEGSTDYVLKPEIEEVQKRVGGNDRPYQLVGAVARPAKQAVVLLFVNGQKEIQFRPETDTSVVITVDSVDLPATKYELAATSDKELIKLANCERLDLFDFRDRKRPAQITPLSGSDSLLGNG